MKLTSHLIHSSLTLLQHCYPDAWCSLNRRSGPCVLVIQDVFVCKPLSLHAIGDALDGLEAMMQTSKTVLRSPPTAVNDTQIHSCSAMK
jgi:hypothetical protein